MKILHLSDGKLPDQRVERAALSAAQRNHEVVFVGGRPIQGQIFNVIKNTYIRPWGQQEKIGIPLSLRARTKWLRQILLEEEPDLIHAHDIFAGKLALDSGYPFVYDDHEYWGVRIKYQGTQIMQPRREPPRRLIIRFAIHNWKIWESQVIHNAPCITVSEEVGRIYRKIQPHTFVIPNVPARNEINMIPPNKNIDTEFRIAYISKGRAALQDRLDGAALSLWQNQKMDGTLVFVGHELFKAKNVENHGFVPHKEMLAIISDCDIALIGARMNFPHLSIQNKFSHFMHTGLKTLVPNTQIVMSRFCREHNVGWVWQTPQQLMETIRQLALKHQHDPIKFNQEKSRVREIANKLLVWENYENRLYEAYDAVLANN